MSPIQYCPLFVISGHGVQWADCRMIIRTVTVVVTISGRLHLTAAQVARGGAWFRAVTSALSKKVGFNVTTKLVQMAFSNVSTRSTIDKKPTPASLGFDELPNSPLHACLSV